MQPPQQGLCVPSTCSDDTISYAINAILLELELKAFGNLTISHVYSAEKDSHGTLTLLDKFCM